MTLLNITFHVACPLKNEFLQWARTQWIPAAEKSGLSSPRLSRVLGGDDPDGISFALEMSAPTLAVARAWFNGTEATALCNAALRQWHQRVLFFATYLDVL